MSAELEASRLEITPHPLQVEILPEVTYPVYNEGNLADAGVSAFGDTFSEAVQGILGRQNGDRVVLLSAPLYPALIWAADGSGEPHSIANDAVMARAVEKEVGTSIGDNNGYHAEISSKQTGTHIRIHAPTERAAGDFLRFIVTNTTQIHDKMIRSVEISITASYAETQTNTASLASMTQSRVLYAQDTTLGAIARSKQALEIMGVIPS